jgi:GxxExxY protein
MIKDKVYYDSLIDDIVSCAYAVHRKLGSGFLEKIYEKAMAIELAKRGLQADSQKPIQVNYDGQVIGEYVTDIVVEDDVIIELKAARKIESIHFAQCLNYLKATGKKFGLVINFGEDVVRFKRIVNG